MDADSLVGTFACQEDQTRGKDLIRLEISRRSLLSHLLSTYDDCDIPLEVRTSKTCNNFGRLIAAERKWMSKTIALTSYLINLMSVQLMNILCLNLESGLWLSLAHILRFISPMFPSRLRVLFIAGPIRSSVVICGEKASP